MPRQAHGRSLMQPSSSKPAKRKSTKGRGLNALQIAESEFPEQVKVRQHRLGESYDDSDEPQDREDVDQRSSKRRKVTHDENEEASGSGSNPDGERWHVGVEDDDEDSDIDSDDAFGESDEEKFAHFTFRGSKSNAGKGARQTKSRKPKDQGTEEGSQSEDDEFGDEGVDLATALDLNEAADVEDFSSERKRRRRSSSEQESVSEPEDDEEGNSDDEADVQSELSVSDQEDGDHAGLQNFVQSLTASKQAESNHTDKRPAPSKISAADLLQYVKDPQQRQSLKILQNNEVKAPGPSKGGIPGRLAPPLAKRHQDRLDRVAAYDESKNELGKWVDTVKQNRRAEHLSFPLVDPKSVLSNDQIVPVFQPQSSLETKIQAIMQESGLSDKRKRSTDQEEQDFEELQEKKLPLAEVQARRAELRKARDLMFREEIRAKRIKKIKSKAFRRIHRKERDRAYFREHASNGLGDSDEEREKNDRQRAEERMGARHRESKWAKAVRATGRAAWDDDARGGVADLARRDEELRRRIEGKDAKGSDESESESESDGYDSGDDQRDIQNRLAAVDDGVSAVPESRLESMAFMKRAEAVRKAANDAEVQALRQQMRDENDAVDDEDSSEEEEVPAIGRQQFGARPDTVMPLPAKKFVNRSEFEELLSGDEDDMPATQDPNVASSDATAVSQATSELGNHAKGIEQPQSGLMKAQPRKPVASKAQTASKRTKSKQLQPLLKHNKGQEAILDTPRDDSGSETSAPYQEPITPGAVEKEPHTLEESIFFGDDTVLPTFETEKAEIVKEEDDQLLEDPNVLPGWGSWTGEGISKKAQRRAVANTKSRNKNKQAVIKGIKPDQRQDRNLDRVIVNEKTVKKNNRYLATELPHPFENRAQYERSLRLPVGPEWTTKKDFQDGVKPRILMKQGVVRAISKPTI